MEGYKTDKKYAKIIKFIEDRKELVEKRREKKLPPITPMVKSCPSRCGTEILEQAHDNTHHHGIKRMVRSLANVSMTSLTRR